MIKSAKECIKEQASSSEMYGRMEAVFIEMDTAPPTVSTLAMCDLYIYSFLNSNKLSSLDSTRDPSSLYPALPF